MNRLLKSLMILLPGLPLSLLIIKLKPLSAPFVLILALWFLLFLTASIIETRKSVKVVLFNLAAIMLILGFFEVYYWRVTVNKLTYRPPIDSPYRFEGMKHDTISHDLLGFALKKNSTRRVTGYYNDDVIYDVTYTTDANGLRISPLPNKANAPAILFFGGSMTYGEGVNDDETVPFRTGILLGREYAIYNFGIHGQGPQHMLAEIEHGIVDSVLTHKPHFAIYQAMPEHVYRVKGLYAWQLAGPHYSLDENGEIIPSSISIPLWTRIKGKIPILARIELHVVQKSFFYNTINRRIRRMKRGNNKQEDTKQKDIQLFAGVVEKTKNDLTDKYQGIEFHVILWDAEEKKFSPHIIEALEKKDINTHKLSNILKDDFWRSDDYLKDNSNPYRIQYDGHPSALMYKIMADYVVKEIIERKLE